MRTALSKEYMIRLFKMDGKPYLLRYAWRKQDHKTDKPLLNQMLRAKEIEVVERDTKNITYRLISE